MKNQVLTIEQMKELKALGIDINKASMCFCSLSSDEYNFGCSMVPNSDEFCNSLYRNNIIPKFTLQDILEMLPKRILHSNKQMKTCEYKLVTVDNKVMYAFNSFDQQWLKCTYGETLLEAAFNMLKWVKQNNYI